MNIKINESNKNVSYKGKTVTLTEKELLLFTFIMKNLDKGLVPTEKIIQAVWPDRAELIIQNNISQLLYRVRQKINQAEIPVIISVSLKKGGVFQRIPKKNQYYNSLSPCTYIIICGLAMVKKIFTCSTNSK